MLIQVPRRLAAYTPTRRQPPIPDGLKAHCESEEGSASVCTQKIKGSTGSSDIGSMYVSTFFWRYMLITQTLTAQQITNRVLASPFYEASKSISCFLSMPGEVDTSPIVLSALRSGKKLYVPKVDSGKMYMVRLYGEEDYR